MHPQKVILSVRDPDVWYRSCMFTQYAVNRSPARYLVWLLPSTWKHIRMTNTVIWDRLFDGRFTDKVHAIRRYQEWIEEVKRVVPADRLLVFDNKQGWEPLCKFLGKPVPPRAFPKPMQAADYRQYRRGMVLKMLFKEFVVPVAAVAVAVWAVRRFYFSQR